MSVRDRRTAGARVVFLRVGRRTGKRRSRPSLQYRPSAPERLGRNGRAALGTGQPGEMTPRIRETSFAFLLGLLSPSPCRHVVLPGRETPRLATTEVTSRVPSYQKAPNAVNVGAGPSANPPRNSGSSTRPHTDVTVSASSHQLGGPTRSPSSVESQHRSSAFRTTWVPAGGVRPSARSQPRRWARPMPLAIPPLLRGRPRSRYHLSPFRARRKQPQECLAVGAQSTISASQFAVKAISRTRQHATSSSTPGQHGQLHRR